MSAIATPDLSYGDVKDSIEIAKGHLEKAAEQVVWQIENHAWTVLGYADWNEMREAEYGGAAFMVPKAERPELVARMRAKGLTQEHIAATAGVSERRIRDDLRDASTGEMPVEDAEPPVITNSRGQQRPSSYARRNSISDDVAEFPDLAYYAADPGGQPP